MLFVRLLSLVGATEQLMHAILCAVIITTLQAVRLIGHYRANLYALPLLFVNFKGLLPFYDLPHIQLAHYIKYRPIF